MEVGTYKKFTEINLVFVFSLAMVASLLAPYLQSVGFFDWQISLMFMVFPLANIIFLPFFGKLADKLNRRLIIWFGIWLEIIALILYVINQHWGIIVAARFLDAIAASLVALIILAKIEDSLTDEFRGKYTGLSLSLTYLGRLIGPLAGAFLADYFFIKLPFIVSAVILFILSFFLLSGRFKIIKHLPNKLFHFSWWSEIKLFLSHRQLKGMGIMGMVMHAAHPAIQIFLPLFIIDYLGLSYKSIGIAMFFHGFTHLFQGWFGKWSDKLGHWKIVMLGTIIAGIFLMVIPFIQSFWLLLVVLFIIGTGSGMWNVSAWSLMSEIGEKEKTEARVVTSYFSIAKIGALISFLLSALLVKVCGLEIIFLLAGLVIILGNFFAFKYLRPSIARESKV